MTKRRTRNTLTIKAAIMGPTTHTIPDTSGFPSTGVLGLGRRGGSPGGTSLISRDKYSEKGDEVYKC